MRFALALLSSLVAATSVAEIVSESIDAIEVTIYRDPERGDAPLSLDEESNGLAMVTETRTIEVPAGASTIQFRGVADSIVPQTAKLDDIPATIVEANFDYNLLSPGTLIAKSLGRPVVLIRTNRASGAVERRAGTLRSGPAGVVVDFGNEVEALNCSGLNERLVFADVPESLRDTPTLSMSIQAAAAGTYQVQLSYLALGMDWSADYTARLHPDGQGMDISAWITLLNRNGSRFANATTHVVAGTLARDEEETLAPGIYTPLHVDRCWPIGDFRQRQRVIRDVELRVEHAMPAMLDLQEVMVTGYNSVATMAVASELGDYKLYTLPFSTNVEARQLKQAQLLDLRDVRIERFYEHHITYDNLREHPAPYPARSMLRLINTKRMGLGVPLPAGTWRVVELTADGRQYLVGEHTLEDTPVNLPRDIHLGNANDVMVSSRLLKEQTSDHESKAVIEVEITNASSDAVEVRIRHSQLFPPEAKIVKESRRHRIEQGDYVWPMRVGARKRSVLRYTMVAPED